MSHRSHPTAPAPFEPLEPRTLFAANPVITEFLASNQTSLDDGFGNSSDWIELYNAGNQPVDLADHHLTDSAGNLTKWRFTDSTVLNPGDYRIVFASGLDQVDPAGYAHTNFSLSAGGEYLALTSPEGQVLSSFGENGADYPPQVGDIAYGRTGQTIINATSPAQVLAPIPSSNVGTAWTGVNYNAAAIGFTAATSSIGYENNPGSAGSFAGIIGTTLPSGTLGAYQRITFSLDSADDVTGLQLLMQSDDGFIAYLNGFRVAERNAPANPVYNSTATTDSLSDQEAAIPAPFSLDGEVGRLRDGTNVLAIHALNAGSGSSDMLSIATLNASFSNSGAAYLASPTPGTGNAAAADVGPQITVADVAPTAVVPTNAPLTVNANVAAFTHPVNASTVRLHYRTGFGGTATVAMTAQPDGTFQAQIPASAIQAGQMTRWYVSAQDTEGTLGRGPRFLDPVNSPEYFGVVGADPSIDTDLTLIQWFVQNTSGTFTDAGARGSVVVRGVFYDNIDVNAHGQSTRGNDFAKKSFDFDANSGHKFDLGDEVPKVSDFNLLTNYGDQSKLRHSLANFATAQTGGAHLLAEPVTVYRNGQFYGLFDLVEDGDSEYLERLGLDPNNPLYKVNNPLNSATEEISKESRKFEGFEDFQEILTGEAFGPNRTTAGSNWDFDTLDLASWVNLAASQSVIGNNDYGHKNQFLYRDTTGTGQWSLLPWDLDLSFGHYWNPNDFYFDPTLIVNRFFPSTLNDVIRRLHNTPRFQEMFEQRVANLTVQLFGAAGTSAASSVVGTEINRLSALIADEAVADQSLWGRHPNFNQTPAQAQSQLLNSYVVQRRNYLLARLPAPETGSGALRFGTAASAFDIEPASGDLAEQYLTITNPTGAAIDLSGWSLSGGIDFAFSAGTVLAAGDTLHVAADVQAFLDRTTGARGGQQRFVQGNYTGQLSANGETIELRDENGGLVDSWTTPNTQPDLHHDQLRVTEVHYNPAGPEELTEFIELTNVSSVHTLDLTGVAITGGPSTPFVFGAGTTLAPGASLVVVGNAAGFAAAYPGVPVAGTFIGSLSNSGETIALADPNGDELLSFLYDDAGAWPEAADGDGPSLTLIAPTTDVGQLGDGPRWRASFTPGGTPGTLIDAAPAAVEGRYTFYNRSFFDGNNAAANAADDNAIATDKQALRPGETATFANVTSYHLGVNGVALDIRDLASTSLQADDFAFAVGDGTDPAGFVAAAITPVIDVRPGAGTNDADRISLVLPNGTARNQWLRVTVLANADTGLTQDDTFYFGNLPGETGNATGVPRVSTSDIRRTAFNSGRTAAVDNPVDHNRSGRVTSTDIRLAAAGSGASLALLAAPPAPVSSPLNDALTQRAAASYTQWQQMLSDAEDDADDEDDED